MRLKTIIPLLILISTLSSFAQQKYFGETPPGMTPKVFAKGFISTDTLTEFGSVFNRQVTV